MLKNHGLDILKEKAEQSNEDWVFGAIPSCLALIPEEQRFDYLPKGERQNTGEEKMDCASRSVLNILVTKFNYLVQTKKITFQNEMWLKEMGFWTPNGIEFSDAFVAINSGTTRQGNSLKAPLEAVRKQG